MDQAATEIRYVADSEQGSRLHTNPDCPKLERANEIRECQNHDENLPPCLTCSASEAPNTYTDPHKTRNRLIELNPDDIGL